MRPYEKKQLLKKLIIAAVAAAASIALAVFAAFVPFDTLLPALPVPAREEGALRLHFLDVGQGDCTLVEFPDGELLVVDAGDGSFMAEKRIIRYIKGLNPVSVSLLVTHADVDHYGGASALLGAVDMQKVYLPAVASEAEEYTAMLGKIRSLGLETLTLTRYKTIVCGEAYAVCLSPYSLGETDENDSSTVLYLTYGGVSAMLCGDITQARERKLVQEYHIDNTLFSQGEYPVRLEEVDLLKAAHHGSGSSGCAEWMELLRPKTLVVTCGKDNRYGHPDEEMLSRYRRAVPDGGIYRTDELGDIIVSIREGKYSVMTDWE